MNRQAHLAHIAAQTRRRVWAQLPLQVRLAEVVVKLAGMVDDIGRIFYTEFARRGVIGLPDINGVPALVWVDSEDERRIPASYGRPFAVKLWRIAMQRLRNPQVVQDAMQDFATSFLVSKTMTKGMHLRSAENYVIAGVLNAGRGIQRAQRNQHEVSVYDDRDQVEVPAYENFTDPESVTKLDDTLSRGEMVDLITDCTRAAPDGGLFLRLLLDGYDMVEIVGDFRYAPTPKLPVQPGLSGVDPSPGVEPRGYRYKREPMLPYLKVHPMTLQGWCKGPLKKIYAVVVEHLEKHFSREELERAQGGRPDKMRGRGNGIDIR